MKRERNEKATHNFLPVSQSLKKTAATIVLPLIVLFFAQLIATAQTNASFQFLDEDSQEGATLGALSTPRPWLTTVVNDWMSKLPDNIKVADLSIPGTHDTGTFKISIASGARTQNWTIRGQLDAGMRFLDLRAHPSGNTFKVYHGDFYMDVTFDEVMGDIKAFLAAHPREGIIIQLQEEGRDAGAGEFQTIWNNYLTRYGISVLTPTSDAFTLKDLRGKILLRSQIEKNMVMQNYWDVWFLDDNNYDAKSHRASLRAKLNLIEKYLKDAQADKNGTWFFNSLSGATHMTPVDVARATNQKAYDLIGVSTGTKRKLGIMQMDFPNERLVYRIIKSNFAQAPPEGARECAKEGERCQFSGTGDVSYGAGDKWITKTATNGINCGVAAFGTDPAPNVLKTCKIVAVATKCADEGGVCVFTGTRTIRYGANGIWAEKTATSVIHCGVAGFGRDPVPNVLKQCYIVPPTIANKP